MPSRSNLFTLIPWTGGVNDSADPGAIPANDLVRADNVLNSTSGARIKRKAFAYVDDGDLPAISSAAATNVDATLVVATGVFTKASHGFSVNDPICFDDAGTATGLSVAGAVYYIRTVPSANTFTVSSTIGGSSLTFTGTDANVSYGYVTITFASSINNGTNNKLVSGENITVVSTTATASMTAVPIWTASGTAAAYPAPVDRKSTRLNSSHITISYAVFCLKKKKKKNKKQKKKKEKSKQMINKERE